MRMHIALSVLAIAALEAVSACAANSVSLDGEWKLDYWPQLSDAVVDYYGGKKRAYYALKNAQRDQIVCVVDDHTAWAINDALRPVKGRAVFTDVETGDRRLAVDDFEIPANLG